MMSLATVRADFNRNFRFDFSKKRLYSGSGSDPFWQGKPPPKVAQVVVAARAIMADFPSSAGGSLQERSLEETVAAGYRSFAAG